MKRFFVPLFLIITSFYVFTLEVPTMNGFVNDTANVMTSSEKQEANYYLSSLESATGIQIAILTIPSLQNESIENYSIKVAEKWKLGQKDKDNGALLLVAVNDRQLRIETGYGLESSLTDAKSGLIIRNVITPFFRTGEYGEGLIAGVKSIGGVVTNNAEIQASQDSSEQADEPVFLLPFAFFAIFFIIFLGGVGRRSSSRNGFLSYLILSSLLSGRRNRFYGSGHNSTSSGFSNHNDFFKGGGFGGFSGGGGHFGGGGASGRW